uniref:pentapeptide repeat-containing protein n=1 Tax=Actinosynnema sp. TaxID=1872144 RepID=UPI003F83A925
MATFFHASFRGCAYFWGATFADPAILGACYCAGTRFKDDVMFDRSVFEAGADLRGA